jgi:DNA invertase Pin-like site-specific DNA recombinase
MTTCYGYTRVSTVKQGEGVSLEAQREEITRYADRHGLTIARWFEEKETAAKSGRPIFNQVVRDLKAGRADGLIVHKIDRSARNFRDWAIVGDLADSGVQIHFATESLDFQSRGGRLTADIQAVIASDYIRNLREEALKGIRGRLKQGLLPGRAPIGYFDQGGGKPKIPDPAKAPLIREMFELYATGNHGIRSLHELMRLRGLKNLKEGEVTRHGIETILNNPFYCGIIRIKRTGETYEGCHEPLITASLFQRVQDIKSGKCGKKVTRHMHTYRGLFKCAHCAFAMIPERQKGWVYYRCHTPGCPTKGVREDAIETAALAFFDRNQVARRKFTDLEAVLEQWCEQRREKQRETDAVRMQLGQLEARKEKLTDALIDGLIDKDAYQSRNEKLLFEQRRLQEKLKNPVDPDAEKQRLRNFLEQVKSLAPLYESAKPHEKRNILRWATSNRTVAGKSIALEPSNWLEAAQFVLTAPYGEGQRPTPRTPTEMLIRRLDELNEFLKEEKEPDLLRDFMDMFDRYISGPRKQQHEE